MMYKNNEGRRCVPGQPAELQWRAVKLMVVDWRRDRGLADLKSYWAGKKLYPKRGIDIIEVMEPDGIIKFCLALQRQIMENFISFYSRKIAAPYVINRINVLLPPPREVRRFPPGFWRPSRQEMQKVVAAEEEVFSDDAGHEDEKVDDKIECKDDHHPGMPDSHQGEMTHRANNILTLFTCAVALGSMNLKALRPNPNYRITGLIAIVNFFTALVVRFMRVTMKPTRPIRKRSRTVGKRTAAVLILLLNILTMLSVIDLGKEFHLHQAPVANLRLVLLTGSVTLLVLLCGGRKSHKAGELLMTAVALLMIGATTVKTFQQINGKLICHESVSRCGTLKVLFLSAVAGTPVVNVVAGIDDFRGHGSMINTVPVAASMATATLFLSHTFIEDIAKRRDEAIKRNQTDDKDGDLDKISEDKKNWVEQHHQDRPPERKNKLPDDAIRSVEARHISSGKSPAKSFLHFVNELWRIETFETQTDGDEGVSGQVTNEAAIANLVDRSEDDRIASEVMKVREEAGEEDQNRKKDVEEIRNEDRETSSYSPAEMMEIKEACKTRGDKEEIFNDRVDKAEIGDLAGQKNFQEDAFGVGEADGELPGSMHKVKEYFIKSKSGERNRVCLPVKIPMLLKQFCRCYQESRDQVDDGTVEDEQTVSCLLYTSDAADE